MGAHRLLCPRIADREGVAIVKALLRGAGVVVGEHREDLDVPAVALGGAEHELESVFVVGGRLPAAGGDVAPEIESRARSDLVDIEVGHTPSDGTGWPLAVANRMALEKTC